MTEEHEARKRRKGKKTAKKFGVILLIELLLLIILAGSYYIISKHNRDDNIQNNDEIIGNNDNDNNNSEEKLSLRRGSKGAERLLKEIAQREELIEQAYKLTLSYDYDGAIELIKAYRGNEGGYEVYPALVSAVNDLVKEKESLVLYGGSYTSVTQINHIFFHSLIADNSKAFDGDYDSTDIICI